jgi:hypothetical protein
MVDHPLYAMWRQVYQAELEAAMARARLRAQRAEEQREWRQAWETYERHWHEARRVRPARPWWRTAGEWCLAGVLWLLTPPATWLAERRRDRSAHRRQAGTPRR